MQFRLLRSASVTQEFLKKKIAVWPLPTEDSAMALATAPAETTASTSATQEKRQNEAEQSEQQQREMREDLRRRCMETLRMGLHSRAWTELDFQQYYRECLSDHALEIVGKIKHEQKVEAIKENLAVHIPRIIREIPEREARFRNQIELAKKNGWIGAESARDWIARLEDPNTPWWKKNLFLAEKFPTYFKNWEAISRDMKKVRDKQKVLGLGSQDLPELRIVNNEGFKDTHYTFRRQSIDKALAALAAYERNRKTLFDMAQRMLGNAAASGALSKSKVGSWLRKIFETESTPEEIQKFIKGGGSHPLSSLIQNWHKASKRFNDIEAIRKRQGSPASFHFVTKEKFLDMHFEARLSYLEEAERRMKDIQISKVKPLFLDIRRELDSKDWKNAEKLIEKAKTMELSPKEKSDLGSMEQFLKTHRKEIPGSDGEKDPVKELKECMAEVRTIAPSLGMLFQESAKQGIGVMYALKSLIYNRVWCRNHGHLNDEKEEKLWQTARMDTEKVVKFGHGRKYENNTIEYGQAAVRTHKHGEWAPQVLHYVEGHHAALVEKMKAGKDNYSFKYWTTLIPRNVDYEKQRYILYQIFPRIMSCMRKIPQEKLAMAV